MTLVFTLTTCIEIFDPPREGFEDLLVVEAFLTDEDKPFEVKLSRSIPLDTTAWIAEPGAQIQITDDAGKKYSLWEVHDGIYQYPGDIDTRDGKSYRLHINTSNGRSYVSDWVTMRETPPIDSVTWEYEERPAYGLQGIQFYVNTHDPENNTRYYRWEWEETWVFLTPFDSNIYWDDGQIKPRKENINICWKHIESAPILITTSSMLDRDLIHNHPLYYADNTTDRFTLRYSLNVKQYALSEESYHYWKELKKVTENLGTLFDPLPSTLRGNIHEIDHENEIVLGYFDASAAREQRIFISNTEIPRMKFPNYYRECEQILVDYWGIEEMAQRGLWLVRETRIQGALLYIMSTPECIDCTRAGTNVKPDFWY
jgi:hypothetical protein